MDRKFTHFIKEKIGVGKPHNFSSAFARAPDAG